jgi:hypothetical protein
MNERCFARQPTARSAVNCWPVASMSHANRRNIAAPLSNALQQQHLATAAMLSNAAKAGVLIL